MTYHSLKGIHYSKPEDYDQELNYRLKSPTTRFSKLFMHPFDKRKAVRLAEKFEVFYLPTLEIDELKEQIFTNSRVITEKIGQLPDVAQQQLFLNTLVFELQSTNNIEGIHSSKKELGDAIYTVISKSESKGKRFIGLVKQYLRIGDNKFNSITNISQFRSIWDDLVSEEEKDDLPDGKLFRAHPETIMSGDQVIHEGDPDEKSICADLEQLILVMNGNFLPSLEKCFIAHYFYEYIHPFYDGNGRTGRYIACSYIAPKLDTLTAVSFSSAIAKNKNYYYKSFTEMANKYNHGDATIFIQRMLTILKQGQDDLLRRIDEGIKLLDKANEFVDQSDTTHSQKNILFLLCEEHIFGVYVPKLTDKDLTKMFDTSRYLLDKDMKVLEDKDFVSVIKDKPKTHILSKKWNSKLPQLQ